MPPAVKDDAAIADTLPIEQTSFVRSVPPDGLGEDLPTGARVGRYVVLKTVGRGGMGVVYAAFDEELDRRVALKLLRMGLHESQGSDGASRLLREAQAMAKLSQPNVVTVYDVGTFGSQVFLAMEYVDGATLRAWRAAQVRAPREIVAMYAQAGRGLVAAHAAGILHRDFKPENVVVDGEGRARVLDFGLARIEAVAAPAGEVARLRATSVRSSAPPTMAGTLVGTPAYMAPEQLRGERADARSDQFAFAVALFEALYGERPHDGNTVGELLLAIEREHVKAPAGGAKVPRGVRAAIVKALHAKPADRFASMTEMLAALERAIASPTRWASAIGVGVVGVVVAAIAVARPAAVKPCRGAAEAMAKTWSAARAAEIARAFTASGSTHADEAWAHTRPLLDAYAASWVAMNTDTCEATRVRGVQSEEALDLRMACLGEREDELRATVDLFARADKALVDRSVQAAATLPPVTACADLAALRAPFAAPRDETQRRAVDGMRARLAEGAAMDRAGKWADALALATTVAEEAAKVGYAPVRAEALFQIGQIQATLTKAEAAATLLDAALEAEGTKADELAARAWTELALWKVNSGHTDDAARDLRVAEAAVRRAGDGDVLRADVLHVQSRMAYNRGAPEGGMAAAREELALREKALGPTHPETMHARADVAQALWDKGDLDGSLAISREVYRLQVESMGAAHPAALRTLMILGASSTLIGEYAATLETLAKVEPNIASMSPPSQAAVRLFQSYALVGTGEVAKGIARFEEALSMQTSQTEHGAEASDFALMLAYRQANAEAETYANRSLEIFKTAELREQNRAGAWAARALCKVRRGDAAGALVDADAALAFQTPNTAVHFIPHLARGQALLALHREAEGLADLERAMQIGDADRGDRAIRADTRFAVARGLVATHGDHARAMELATRAPTELDALGLGEAAKRVRAWMTE